MKKISRLCALAAACLFGLSCFNVYAANPCQLSQNGGIGGTGITTEDGIGGTGYTEGGGIGGTGDQVFNGVGGTGSKLAVIGTVTGFASVCVNGIEVHFDDNTAISINGETANSSQLAVGQLVSVTAESSTKGWNALKIHSSDAVSGPLTKFTAPNRAEIAGQTIHLPNELIGSAKEKLSPGQHISVQGVRLTNGEILATTLTKTSKTDVIVTGAVEAKANGRVSIGKLNLANFKPQLFENNQQLTVTGQLNGDTLLVRNTKPALQVDTQANYLSIQSGVASAQKGQLYLTNGIKIHTNQVIKSGSLLQVNAYKDKNGLWQSLNISDKSHHDLMKRAGNRYENSRKDSKENSDSDEEQSDSDSTDTKNKVSNSGSGSSGAGNNNYGSNNGSSNSGSSNSRISSGSDNGDSKSSGSSNRTSSGGNSGNSGSSSERATQTRSGSANETIRVDKVERVDNSGKVEKVERADRPVVIEKVEKIDKVERVETIKSSDRVRADERGNSGRGKNN